MAKLTTNYSQRKYIKMNIEELTEHHLKGCKEYRKMVATRFKGSKAEDIFIHCNIFKESLLVTERNSDMIEYASSGTSGKPSKIAFTRQDAVEQQRLLMRTIKPFLTTTDQRLFVELENKNDSNNARRAAGRGFALLGKKRIKITPDQDGIENAINICNDKQLSMILFGFTFEIYELLERLESRKLTVNKGIDLIHGGGWKKLERQSVSNKKFNETAKEKIRNINIINYYGMVEQLGLIYPSCSEGYFHVPQEASIIIRNEEGERAVDGVPGMIQSISLLPKSYPGHSILTEDIGRIIPGECECGRKTTRFEFIRRLKKTEARGCSDAY